MGANQSESGSKDDGFSVHCEQLYSDLISNECPHFQLKLNPYKFLLVSKNGFFSLFGRPSSELGRRLYHTLFHGDDAENPVEVDCDTFILAMTKLRTIIVSQNSQESFLSLFLISKGNLESDLQALLDAAVSCALHIGSACELTLPKHHPLLSAMVSAMMLYNDQHRSEPEITNIQQWASVHSPHMLTGLCQWLCAILCPKSERETLYLLPLIDSTEKERLTHLHVQMWVLSGVLPALYLGSQGTGGKIVHGELAKGGIWTRLYSSRDHGLSMNRFQHHCFDYKQPSVMIVDCLNKETDEMYSFALAMDSEWRDGTYFYGGENFCFVQLRPSYSLLKKGARLVSLNEKQRGFPKGLRVMASDKYDYCLLELKSSFEEARLKEDEWLRVDLVEVWGCGGMQATETQQRIKQWEARQALRHREINRDVVRTAWKDNPDRYLLEMGGVTTSTENI